MAEAATSGKRLQMLYCRCDRPGYVLHTVFASRVGSVGIASPRMSLPSALRRIVLLLLCLNCMVVIGSTYHNTGCE